jgi:uncharacterized RDD family membrane protein YckC
MGQPEFRYASWAQRVAAYVIDLAIVFLLGVILAFAGFAVGHAVGGRNGAVAGLILLLLVWIALAYVGYWAYGEGRPSGQTVGKRALGIRVRAAEGGAAGFRKALGRNVAKLLLGVIPVLGFVDLLWPLWDPRKQCLHDKVASTVVLRD